MGVSGAGKSTVGARLARELGWRFIEGDDLHPPANVEKMARGEGLTDADRREWLADMAGAISSAIERGESVVVASSALKQSYRDRLSVDPERVTFVFLRGEPDLIAARIADRREHYAGAELLPSQFEALEEPDDVPTFDVSAPLESLVDDIRNELEA